MTSMHRLVRRARAACAAILAVACAAPLANAQITSAAVGGTVRDSAGVPLPDIQLVLTHVETGARYVAVSRADGRYVMGSLRPGGPYELAAQRIGFQRAVKKDLYLSLGNTLTADFALKPAAAQLQQVTITDRSPDGVDTRRKGPATNVGLDQLGNLPTLSRSLQDMTRLTPSANANSFGGNNFRYNNITIDGAANNDVFSFSNSYGGVSGTGPIGTPGAGAKTQPISLDAIQEVQVTLAPFDVQLGNFTGGSVNAVTRSGTNRFEGSVYAFGRNDGTTGPSADSARSPIASYQDYQFGARLGGPLVRDKAFFFVNAEIAKRDEPVLFAPGDPGTVVSDSLARAVADTFAARYAGYDAYNGTRGQQYRITANSTKLFGRLDFNLSDEHKLSIRHNFISADAGQLQRGAANVFFPGQDFVQKNTTNTTVAELKSLFRSGLSNNLVASLSITEDKRDPVGTVFPQVEIGGPSGSTLFFGTNREAAVFKIGTKVFELTDNLVIARGNHTITVGTHNEFYGIDYTFQNAWNGRWQYSSIANFYANRPSRIRATYSLTDNSYAGVLNTPVADFKVLWPSAYIQDEIALGNLRITPGLRLDMPLFPDKVPTNPAFTGDPNFSKYKNDLGGDLYVSPRVSFNWDVLGDQTLAVRGGTGIFMGRIPFAWLAYPYYNNGLKYNNVDCRPSATAGCAGNNPVVPLVSNPATISSLQSGVYEMNIIDNGFKLPTVNRSSLAVDKRFAQGFQVTLEGTYTKSINDVKFLNIGLKDSTVASPIDGRPIFLGSPVQLRKNPAFTSVFLLTNTSDGDRYSLTAEISRRVPMGVTGSFAYTYGTSRDVSNGIRNSPQSNWEYNQTPDPRNPALTASNFDIRHRVVATLGWRGEWARGWTFSTQAVYTAISGQPFTFVYANDYNGDGSSQNDLVYVPKDSADARLANGAQWAALNSFINSQPGLNNYRGQVAPRNSGRTPWNQQLDLRISQDLPVSGLLGTRVQFTADIINAMALFGADGGKQWFVPNENNYNVPILSVASRNTALGNNVPATFSYIPIQNNTPYQYDAIASRYQVQLGLRVSW
jgi:hypothetical protein